MKDSFNARDWFIAYHGHGNLWNWGDSPFFLKGSGLGALTQTGNPPFVLALTCSMNDAFKPTWGPNCLGPDLLRTIDGGAVAVWAPTSLSYNYTGELVGQAFVESMCLPATKAVGDAQLHALRALRDHPDFGHRRWQASTIQYFGDPALDMRPGGSLIPRPSVFSVR